MNQFVANIFSTLLKLLHFIVAIAIILLVASGVNSGNSFILIYALIASIVYVVVIGFLSVVLSIHENIASILNIMQKDGNQSIPVLDNIVNSNVRVEPKI
jgi:hypothetical protein